MKKVLILAGLLILVLGLSFFFARDLLFPNSSLTSGPVTLVYWGVEQDDSHIRSLITKYEQQNPNIKINYQEKSLSRYRETVQNRLQVSDGPDIVRYHNTWVPMLGSSLAALPANVMDEKLYRERFYPISFRDLKFNNKIVGLPLDFDSLALVYNTAALASAGYSSPPSDWYQFRQMAKKLTVRDDKGQVLVGGAALGTSNNVDYYSDILGMMFLQNGTQMVTDFQVTFDKSLSNDANKSNLGADALGFYTVFVTEDKVWDRVLPSSVDAFVQGRANMILAPASRMPDIIKRAQVANPQIAFKVAPIPQLTNRDPVSWGSFWVEGVSAKSKNQREAWKFLAFLSEKESLRERANQVSKASGLALPYGRKDMKEELLANPYLGPYVHYADSARSWYLASGTFDTGINDKTIEFLRGAINSVLNNSSPNSALQNAAKGVGEVLIKYNLVAAPPEKK